MKIVFPLILCLEPSEKFLRTGYFQSHSSLLYPNLTYLTLKEMFANFGKVLVLRNVGTVMQFNFYASAMVVANSMVEETSWKYIY